MADLPVIARRLTGGLDCEGSARAGGGRAGVPPCPAAEDRVRVRAGRLWRQAGAYATKANRRLVASCQAAGSARRRARSCAEWLADRPWRFSGSETTARATATAACRPGAVTVTTVMILPGRCALTMLAGRRHAAWPAAVANVAGSGAAIAGNCHGDVVAAEWFIVSGTVRPVSGISGPDMLSKP